MCVLLFDIYVLLCRLLPAKAASSHITYVIQKMYFKTYHEKWTKVNDEERGKLLDLFKVIVS